MDSVCPTSSTIITFPAPARVSLLSIILVHTRLELAQCRAARTMMISLRQSRTRTVHEQQRTRDSASNDKGVFFSRELENWLPPFPCKPTQRRVVVPRRIYTTVTETSTSSTRWITKEDVERKKEKKNRNTRGSGDED